MKNIHYIVMIKYLVLPTVYLYFIYLYIKFIKIISFVKLVTTGRINYITLI